MGAGEPVTGIKERGIEVRYKGLVVWLIVGLAVVSVALAFYSSQQEHARRLEEERVVIIRLSGGISEGTSPLFAGGGITPEGVRRQLDTVREDPSIDAVVLRIDSSGGSVAASQEISAMISEFPLPVVVSMGDMAVSGGYYIAAASEGIVAQPGTMTGSIGVILQAMNLDGLYDKLGIEVEVITSGEHKDLMQRRLDEEDRRLLQDLSDEAYDQFVAHVAEGRDMSREEVLDVATGEIFFGSQAYALGLVDRLGGEPEAIELAGERAGLQNPVRYELPPPSPWQRLQWFGIDATHLLRAISQPDELHILNQLDRFLYPRIKY